MEFKVSTASISIPTLKILNGNFSISLEELIQSKSSLNAKVVEILKGNNLYLVEILGRQIKLQSETKLLTGESLQLNVNRLGKQVQLEILNRSNSSIDSFKHEDIWSKNYFSPFKLVSKTLESKQTEISIQKIVQLLDVFFPGIDWNQDTQYFEWNFSEGEAKGFFGKNKDSFGFYLHYSSKALGSVDSHFNWKMEDLSDLVIHSMFDNLSTYLYANENLDELKKMLSSNSILTNTIVFHYSSVSRMKGNWVA